MEHCHRMGQSKFYLQPQTSICLLDQHSSWTEMHMLLICHTLTHKNVSNLIGRSGIHIFLFFKRGRKTLKIFKYFVTSVGKMQWEHLVSNGNQYIQQIHQKIDFKLTFKYSIANNNKSNKLVNQIKTTGSFYAL